MRLSEGDLVLAIQPHFPPWPGRVFEIDQANEKIVIEWFSKGKSQAVQISPPLPPKNVQYLTRELLLEEEGKKTRGRHRLELERKADIARALTLLDSPGSLSCRAESPLTSPPPSPDISVEEDSGERAPISWSGPHDMPVDKEKYSASIQEIQSPPETNGPQADGGPNDSSSKLDVIVGKLVNVEESILEKALTSAPMETEPARSDVDAPERLCGGTETFHALPLAGEKVPQVENSHLKEDFETMEKFVRGKGLWEKFLKIRDEKGKKLSTDEGDKFILSLEELLRKEVKNVGSKSRHVFLSRSDGWFTAARKKAAHEVVYHPGGRKVRSDRVRVDKIRSDKKLV
ncbi:hypothetical protein BDP27DRAFT_1371017 [Rhodocollybia butyracea]|uniref:PWWP domain-containing protein n=1 Tax=Rhodocollybia butyracea TaxID=206335 RepID=A0A9P5PAG5_9AGAR|nr:hypothetical protein BDP27DRAFT_1371017 [Rhodocollybia butyracea]